MFIFLPRHFMLPFHTFTFDAFRVILVNDGSMMVGSPNDFWDAIG